MDSRPPAVLAGACCAEEAAACSVGVLGASVGPVLSFSFCESLFRPVGMCAGAAALCLGDSVPSDLACAGGTLRMMCRSSWAQKPCNSETLQLHFAFLYSVTRLTTISRELLPLTFKCLWALHAKRVAEWQHAAQVCVITHTYKHLHGRRRKPVNALEEVKTTHNLSRICRYTQAWGGWLTTSKALSWASYWAARAPSGA